MNYLKGYCFVEYPSSEIAENATAILDGYVLDKNHTFSANVFLDLHKFEEPDLNWKAPTPRAYTDFVSSVVLFASTMSSSNSVQCFAGACDHLLR